MVDAALFFWSECCIISSLLAVVHALSSISLLHLVTPTHLSNPLCRHNFLQEAYPALSHCPTLVWVTVINHCSTVLPKLMVHIFMTIKMGCVVICFLHWIVSSLGAGAMLYLSLPFACSCSFLLNLCGMTI